jgi:hypothetical protein
MSIPFERFNPDGQNSPDAIVYLQDRSLLLYKGMHYTLDKFYTIPEDATVDPRFSLQSDYLFLEIHTVNRIVYKECAPCFFPDEEQKEKLTVLFKKHGLAVKESAQKVLESIKDLKKLIKTHREEINDDIFPNLKPDYIYHDNDCCVPTGGCEDIGVEKLERAAREMIFNAHYLALAEPWASSKKQKVNE